MSNLKLSKKSNKGLIESALKQIEEETGFHITDIEFGNYYFICGGPKNSICHFHIKEIPKFRFAFWNTNRFDSLEEDFKNGDTLWSDYYEISTKSELVFFTQFERDIDKFKPSCSGFVQGIFRQAYYDFDENDKKVKKEEWYLFDLVRILEFMNKHPYKAYIYSRCGMDNVWNEVSDFCAVKEYIEDAYRYKVRKFKHWLKLNYLIRASKKFVKKLKNIDYIIEKRDGWIPEIEVRLTSVTDDIETLQKDVTIIEKFEDKYFNDISIFCGFDYFDEYSEQPQKEVEKRNKQLHKYFYKYADDLEKILNGESKYTLEDMDIEKVIDMKISKEVN